MHTFREHAACLGVSGDFSVVKHVLGFSRGTLPRDPDPFRPAVTVSMRDQITAVEGLHIHLNIIRVGFDAIPVTDIDEANEKLDWAILRIRQIFAPARLGVGRVMHWEIPQADAGGADDIGSREESIALRQTWSVPNDGIDAFFVRTISADGFKGNSPQYGACEKNDGERDGLFAGPIERTFHQVARSFAHEVGHYLGLAHNHGEACPPRTDLRARNRLMAQSDCAVTKRDSTKLTSGEKRTMRDHCIVRKGC